MIYNGDSLEILPTLPDNSVDSIVSDPPYGLAFMQRNWDKALPPTEIWAECMRVLKPGGYLIAMSASRTYHRLAVQLEDLGMICHPMIGWLYGSGFPKATDLSKQFDKRAGVEREVTEVRKITGNVETRENFGANDRSNGKGMGFRPGDVEYTAPATDQAKKWNGWKYGLQSLKPALEPIAVFQKPWKCKDARRMTENVEKWGVGAMNIDACRVGIDPKEREVIDTRSGADKGGNGSHIDWKTRDVGNRFKSHAQSRHPANLLHDGSESVEREFLEQGGVRTSGASKDTYIQKESENVAMSGKNYERRMPNRDKDTGTASRFFNSIPITELDAPFLYTPKASKRERNAGLGDMVNSHCTVKPIALMEWLVKLVTPPGGTCLDPFMGSGTTGIACKRLGFDFVGIEMTPEYFKIAEARIAQQAP